MTELVYKENEVNEGGEMNELVSEWMYEIQIKNN